MNEIEPVSDSYSEALVASGPNATIQVLGDPLKLLGTLPSNTRLESISPNIATRSGEIPRHLIPSSCISAILNNAPTWERLAKSTLSEIQAWQGVGARRASQVVGFAVSMSHVSTVAPPQLDSANQVTTNMLRCLALVSGWAVVKGVDRGLSAAFEIAELPETPQSVQSAMSFLRDVDLHTLANEGDLIQFDPLRAAAQLLSEFDSREKQLLDRLLARGLRPVPTLEEIGQHLGVTRERVRQLEIQVSKKISQKIETEKYASVRRHADELSNRIGAAFPVNELPKELIPSVGDSFVDELFAYLAGPFVHCDSWFIRKKVASTVEELIGVAFEDTSNGSIAPLDAMKDALEANGVHPHLTEALIATASHYRRISDFVVPWRGLREKVTGVLHATERPMKFEEIEAAVAEGESSASIRNVLATCELVKRTKKDEWALASWEGAEYRNIVDHMREELKSQSLSIAELSANLNEKFDISTTSVTMNAKMHPLFVSANGVTRLRREDEPYIPTKSLEMTEDCYQIDGVWSVAFVVDKDLMRGSGRVMPETFAVHIGLQPGGQGALLAEGRSVKVGWGMNPFFGSLRWVVEREGLVAGDRLFVIRSKPSELAFRFVRAQTISALQNSVDRLKYAVGAADSKLAMERWLGDALGLGGASMPTTMQLRARLLARNESNLVALLDDASSTAQ